MSVIKNLYGSSNVTITAPSAVNSLANNGQVAYPAVDNTSNLFLDALVFVKVKTGGSGTTSNGIVNVYAAGTADGGTTYSDGITPNGSVTLTSNPNVRLIGSVNCTVNSTVYDSTPMSVAAAFGGILPDHWVIIIENKTGGTLDASAGSSAFYQGLQNQVV
jgi:hypothetical protein